MLYLDAYNELKAKVSFAPEHIALGHGLVLKNFDFHSQLRFHPSPEKAYSGAASEADNAFAGGAHRATNATGLMNAPAGQNDGNNPAEASAGARDNSARAGREDEEALESLLNRTDEEVAENLRFRYHMLLPEGTKRAARVIIMFHGLNEKHWDKYLPWAAHLAGATGKAVVLFPIAFHMNRVPPLWNENRPMNKASKERKLRYPDVIHSTLSNVAISTRLHNRPERFIWSGLESYYDVIDLVQSVKNDQHPAMAPEAEIDFCSYSIGTFLGEIIMMTNHRGWFSRSKYATFCGGPVFNRLSPVSKFILDSEANVRLYSYLVEHLESHMKNNAELGRLLSGDYEEGVNFKSLLNYRLDREYREEKFRSMSRQFYALALAQDEVVPPYEVINTLCGSKQDTGVRVEVLDFPYPYRHEDPFPARASIALAVDDEFRRVFGKISAFLGA